MKEEFKDLFEYNNHFNQELIVLISKNLQTVSDKIVKLMNHMINAQQIWNARITGDKEHEVWQINNWDDLFAINAHNHKKTLDILASADLHVELEYVTSKGIRFRNHIKDILFHVVNHSTYHRAQIATELKNCGIEPLITDYIIYKRNVKQEGLNF